MTCFDPTPPFLYDDPRFIYNDPNILWDGGARPYVYDDARLTYDEHCFYYDAPFDCVCLAIAPARITKKKVGGKSTHSTDTARKFPYVNIVINGRLLSINGNNIDSSLANDNTITIKGELESPKMEVLASRSGKAAPREISVSSVKTESRQIKVDANPMSEKIHKMTSVRAGGVIIKAEPLPVVVKKKKTT